MTNDRVLIDFSFFQTFPASGDFSEKLDKFSIVTFLTSLKEFLSSYPLTFVVLDKIDFVFRHHGSLGARCGECGGQVEAGELDHRLGGEGQGRGEEYLRVEGYMGDIRYLKLESDCVILLAIIQAV